MADTSGELRSSLIAGSIALVIYTAISLIVGESAGSAVLGGVLLGLATVLITFGVSRLIGRRRGV